MSDLLDKLISAGIDKDLAIACANMGVGLAAAVSSTVQYKEYIRSDAWRNKRDNAIEAAEGKCRSCGSRCGLCVHHLHYRTLFNENIEDLEVLCRSCHTREHHALSGRRGPIEPHGRAIDMARETVSRP